VKPAAGSGVVAERYARALLAVALDQKADFDRIGKELAEVATLMRKETRLATVLSDPTIAAQKRVEILDQVLKPTKLSSLTGNVLRLLTTNERMPLIDDVSRAFRRLTLEHKQIQPGEVVSAHDLDPEQRTRLAKSLGDALGRTMELGYQVDPALVGGLVVRIGNRIFDASVTTQLRRFKEKTLAGL
jgi:F-type H+-transporting ATPase subunit delta